MSPSHALRILHPARRAALAALVAAAAILAAPPGRAAASAIDASEKVDLSGTWILDPALSREQESDERRLGGLDRRGGERPPGSRTGASPKPSAERELRGRTRRMTIAQSGDTLAFTYGDGSTVRIEVGGKPTEIGTGTERARVEASWSEQGDLVLRTTRDRQVSTETYIVTHDRKLLTVLVEARSTRGDRAARRVYRPLADVPGAELFDRQAPVPPSTPPRF